MILRKTEEKDIDRVMEIIEAAKTELKNLGIDQWQNGYPNKDSIMDDIEKCHSYVLIDEFDSEKKLLQRQH